MIDLNLIKDYYYDFLTDKHIYDKAYNYYKGQTDAIKYYQLVTERSNNKINTNFVKKFVKEEVSYSVGNEVNYLSNKGNDSAIEDIQYNLSSWEEDHDSKLSKDMILFSKAYEVYYVNKQGEFRSKIISPRNGFEIRNKDGEVIYFVHVYSYGKNAKEQIYIDVYDDNNIYFFNDNFVEIKERKPHIFGKVPVGIASLSDEGIYDTIYMDIKGLQDAFETNLSDISNEISDFRNAYLVFTGCEIDKKDATKMKKDGIMQIPVTDGKVSWLIKNINDTFIQNTLKTIEDKMYQITSHINHNEKLQSNTSSLAIRATLISLEEKCKLNQKALANCIKSRIQFLFIFLYHMFNKEYDYKDIKLKFTPNIPQDDLMTAQIISQLGDKLSNETALSLLSFINNPSLENKKALDEQLTQIEGQKLLDGVDDE